MKSLLFSVFFIIVFELDPCNLSYAIDYLNGIGKLQLT